MLKHYNNVEMELKIKTNNPQQTKELGYKLAKFLKCGDVITLSGDLGAGKTTFVNGVAKALKIDETVISPTFNILKCYFNGSLPLYHIDAYRLENIHQDLGLDEYIEGDGVAVIEWPQFIKNLLSIPHLEISIKNLGNDNRELIFKSSHKEYLEKVKKIL